MFFEKLVNQANPFIWAAAGTMVLSLIIQLFYYLGIFSRVAFYRKPGVRKKKIPVSVIICARNEAENLRKHLPRFLSQDYDDYEVVVVDDCSTDNTEDILMDLRMEYPHLRYTTIQPDKKFTHGKKLAVTVGIKSATNEHMLFSDADCYPVTDQWISMMSRHFIQEKELVLGVGKYERKKGLLNLIIRYETLFTAIQYLSFAMRGKAYMGVGRNMGYMKKLFYRHKGFASHLKVLSGDDDLFVNESTTKTNTAVELSHESFTLSIPPTSFRQWFKQKKRHLSTGKYYRTSSKLRLGTEYFSRILFYASTIILLFHEYWNWVGLATWGMLSVVRLVTIKLSMKRLDEKDLLLPSLLLDPLLPLFLAVIKASNFFRPREPKWN
ncbi:MAG: glycosyltransferase [Bacteroidales bacterium]|nr:glycosyltransferase [Bacteroidales bacterium]